MKATAFIAAVGTLTLAGTAMANLPRTYQGEGGIINPGIDVPGGTDLPGITRFEIIVPDSGIIKSVDDIILGGLAHTWAGDLVIRLTHKTSGTTVTLLDRPGFPAGIFGDSADFLAANTYNWQDGGLVYDTDMFGATIPSTTFAPVSGSLSDFEGLNKQGIWSLEIEDWDAADDGSLGSWTLVLSNVPAPGALALLGVAGLAARRRRRSA